jgi:hypothetical protein
MFSTRLVLNTLSERDIYRALFFKILMILQKLFWPRVRKMYSSDQEKLLKFEAEGQEFVINPFFRIFQSNFWKIFGLLVQFCGA